MTYRAHVALHNSAARGALASGAPMRLPAAALAFAARAIVRSVTDSFWGSSHSGYGVLLVVLASPPEVLALGLVLNPMKLIWLSDVYNSEGITSLKATQRSEAVRRGHKACFVQD